ncbi:MAG: response regulator [Gammaproteobacteria bacterium]|nr:response regulator [Gammaproteobacteria bacterium]
MTLPLRLPIEANAEPVISNTRFRQHGAEEPGSSSYPFASRRVLIVDDNRINRRLARSILDAFTLRIDEAAQGEEAIAACQSTRYDLILMDIRMPGMDGMAVTRHLRQTAGGLNQSTPIIGLTADLLREDRDLILSAGMNDCLYKPLSPDALEAICWKRPRVRRPCFIANRPHRPIWSSSISN